MKISEILKSKEVTVSYEVFPPKKDMPFEPILAAVDRLCQSEPDFMSVTYGAGGGTGHNAIKIADHVQNHRGVTSIAHLTCISSSKEQVEAAIKEMKACGIENILALRGDIPADFDGEAARDYRFAADRVRALKAKVDSGVDFLTTQMFFDNNVLYNFLYRIRERGITVPVIAGIMPVTNGKQIERICQLSGTYLPARFRAIVDKFGDNPEAMKQAGIAYATDQIIDLIANGVKGIHIYTMNKPDVAESIRNNLSYIIGK